MPSPDCVTIESPASITWSDSALPESLLRGIAANPDDLIRDPAARPVKISHETLLVERQLPAGDHSVRAAVKQYRPRTLWKALWAIFRGAKAMQNWQKAEHLLARGIATPRPLLACRPRGWRASGTSFLATQWVEGAENLHLFAWRIAARPLAVRLRAAARCAETLGRLLGRLHAAGGVHRDLKAANLLVVENGSVATVYLVDLDGLQTGQQIRFRRRARDLARLAAGLAAHAWVTRPICLRFLHAYLRESPGEGSDWKRLWRAIAAETAAYARRKQERGEKVL